MYKPKAVFLLSCLLFFCFEIGAQEVIGTSGTSHSNENTIVSFTIGEVVIQTYTETSVTLSQGFQQPSYGLTTSIQENGKLDYQVSAFPNPSDHFVVLSVKNPKKHSYVLYDMNGNAIEQKEITKNETRIDFSKLPSSTYLLKVIDDKKVVETFKLIKN